MCVLICAVTVAGQKDATFDYDPDVHVSIRIGASAPHLVHVVGGLKPRSSDKERTIRFMTDYAGVNGLALRISDLQLMEMVSSPPLDRRPLTFKKTAEGEYTADGPIKWWSAKFDLNPIERANAATHLSWMGPEGGVLVIDDLVPQGNGRKGSVSVTVPRGWGVWSTALRDDGGFLMADTEKTVIAVGPMWRERNVSVTGNEITLLLAGSWSFSDEDALTMVREILGHYSKLLGGESFRTQIAIHKFPFQTNAGEWEADARGTSITIASSDMPFKSQSLQRLHEQLRHEMFHLWIPGRLKLTGRYDWFYEGFALYQSLKLGVGVGRIRFEDMLDTLSRAYTIDATNPRRVSLIEASSTRWSGGNLSVYARGMLVAFLCDVALLNESKRKVSTDNIVSDIYSRYSTGESKDANAAITAILKERKSLIPIVDRYILGADAIDWASYLATAGLEARQNGRQTTVSVVANPSGKQKEMLDKLGYNSWRKSAGSK